MKIVISYDKYHLTNNSTGMIHPEAREEYALMLQRMGMRVLADEDTWYRLER